MTIYIYLIDKQEHQQVYSIINLFHLFLMESSDGFEKILFFWPLTLENIFILRKVQRVLIYIYKKKEKNLNNSV